MPIPPPSSSLLPSSLGCLSLAPVEPNDLITYSKHISFSISAPFGWNPQAQLDPYLRPRPEDEQIRQSEFYKLYLEEKSATAGAKAQGGSQLAGSASTTTELLVLEDAQDKEQFNPLSGLEFSF